MRKILLVMLAVLSIGLLVGVSGVIAASEEVVQQGNEEWNKTLRGDNWAYYCSIKKTYDGGYVSRGYVNFIFEGQAYKVDFTTKIGANGSEEWRTVTAPIPIPQTRGSPSMPQPTPMTTPSPTSSTPTPETSGFEVIFAVAGLLAIAYLLLRRRRRK